MRLGAGQSSATLEILHIVRRVTTLSQANIWSSAGGNFKHDAAMRRRGFSIDRMGARLRAVDGAVLAPGEEGQSYVPQ
jgi:hypothetical protein